MTRLIAFFISIFLLAACGGETNNSNSTTTTTQTSSPAPKATPDPEGYTTPYPSISNEVMMDIYENCTLIDYLFYELPISMNMSDKPSIQNALRQISGDPAKVLDSCKPIGRVFYQKNGEKQAEAELYYSAACLYFIFLEDGKPIAGNQMTVQGVNFLKDIIAQAQQAQ